jgi:COP9 signalosome complex subunit 3
MYALLTLMSPKTDNEDQELPSSHHTILYTYILLANIEASASSGKAVSRQVPSVALPEGALWRYITHLLFEFDPIQARYCGSQLLRIVDYVSLGAEQTTNYVPAIQMLHHFILRLDGTSSTLTSTHRTFLRLCLLSQAYAEAAQVLDEPIYHIPSQQTDLRTNRYLCSNSDRLYLFLSPATGLSQPVTSRTYLEYFLLGGMCYMALRRYDDAMLFLEVVLTAPTALNVASAIMVEAYKKWLLVGLLRRGVTPTIPKNVGQNAIKHIRALARPYECVAEAFEFGNIQRLRAEIEAGNLMWQDDNNYGLMVEVYQAFRKFAVLKLGRTFIALSIAEVARRTSPDASNINETKAYLGALISSGALNAVITDGSNGDQALRFLPSSISAKSETAVESALAAQTQDLQILLRHVHDTEHRLEVSREYIDYLRKLKKVKDEEKKNNGRTGAGRSAAVDDVDEDMMEEF